MMAGLAVDPMLTIDIALNVNVWILMAKHFNAKATVKITFYCRHAESMSAVEFYHEQ